jgi:hypothetical protein
VLVVLYTPDVHVVAVQLPGLKFNPVKHAAVQDGVELEH